MAFYLLLLLLPIAFAGCACDNSTCINCDCRSELPAPEVSSIYTGNVTIKDTYAAWKVQIPPNTLFLEVAALFNCTSSNEFSSYWLACSGNVFINNNLSQCDLGGKYSSQWLAPPPGEYEIGYLYNGFYNGSENFSYVDLYSNYTYIVYYTTQTPQNVTGSGSKTVTIGQNEYLFFSFDPATAGCGDYGRVTITADAPTNGLRFALYVSSDLYRPYPGAFELLWYYYGYNDVKYGVDANGAPFWEGIYDSANFPTNWTAGLYASPVDDSSVGLTANVKINFKFVKECNPKNLCPSDVVGPAISFSILFTATIIVCVFSIKNFRERVQAKKISEQQKTRSIAAYITLALSLIGFFIIVWMPFWYWTAIPAIVLIIIYLYGVGWSNSVVAAIWGSCSIVALVWTVFLIFLLAIAAALSILGDDYTAKDKALLVTLQVSFYNLVMVIVNIIVSWCLYASLTSSHEQEMTRQHEAVTGEGEGHAVVAVPL